VKSYLSNISSAISTTLKGLSISIRYFFQARKGRKKEWVAEDNYFNKAEGTFTVQYPHEKIPVPDHGRYQLHNEIDDCIVCDKCAKICPVDCIDIEPVRSPEVFGKTSDGTPLRIHAAKFDIDMAKCCFCGLCTVVCPTECLTMTDEYDFSTSNILDHNFSFSKMNEKEIEEKKNEFEAHQALKVQAKPELPTIKKNEEVMKKPAAKPVFKPRMPKKK
jgi:formate hydrogenlyase subunit 6/NADH:ubiquinone oxidoreductase subunit I